MKNSSTFGTRLLTADSVYESQRRKLIMRAKSIGFGIITVACLILFGASEGRSQTGKGLVADVPFDFYVKGELMAAGKYEFVPAASTTDPSPLIVRRVSGANKKAVVPVATVVDGIKYGAQPVIVFRRYGSEYFLGAVHDWTANVRLQLIQSKRERKLSKVHREAKNVSIKPVRA
jgi:hypothetical protein